MSVSPIHKQKIQDVFDAMELGVAGEPRMLGAFTQDAVMISPFGGEPERIEGLDAIREWFIQAVTGEGPHDLKLSIERIDLDGDGLRVYWTCASAAFPTNMEGNDLFLFEGDLIKFYEINVTKWPGQE